MYPERIVCLGAELPDIFQRLGCLDRVVGISAYTDWPPEALTIKKVSGFRHGRARPILAMEPDLIILTSTVQQPLAAELAGHGVPILHLYPHRLADMFQTVRLLGNLVDRAAAADALVSDWMRTAARWQERRDACAHPLPVYFEEWMDPLIAGTGWVSDLIELAGGRDVFRAVAVDGRTAANRTVTPEQVLDREPQLIFASWCGKPFDRAALESRPGWSALPAVAHGAVVELPPTILQCGPRLMDILDELHAHISQAAASPRERPLP